MARLFFLVVLLMPTIAFAQTFGDFVDTILALIQLLIIGIFGLTLLVIIWGIVKTWILHGGDEHSVEEGRQMLTFGIIGLVVMSGLWGIVEMIRSGLFDL